MRQSEFLFSNGEPSSREPERQARGAAKVGVLPDGFSYQPGLLNAEEQRELIERFRSLDFRPFEFRGYTAKRRIVEFGFEYDFTDRTATPTAAIPEFLVDVRRKAAAFAGLPPEQLVETLITEYVPGAQIGWHRDVPQFDVVVGISLAGSCRMRLKPIAGGKIVSVVLEPGSAYVMRGAARWKYQHSIPAVEELRYSITFRSLRKKRTDKVPFSEGAEILR
jgi:alkylated DNA repair dioxygenase AlkB